MIPAEQPVTVDEGDHLLYSSSSVTVEQPGPDGTIARALFYRRSGDDRIALLVADGPLVLAVGAGGATGTRC